MRFQCRLSAPECENGVSANMSLLGKIRQQVGRGYELLQSSPLRGRLLRLPRRSLIPIPIRRVSAAVVHARASRSGLSANRSAAVLSISSASCTPATCWSSARFAATPPRNGSADGRDAISRKLWCTTRSKACRIATSKGIATATKCKATKSGSKAAWRWTRESNTASIARSSNTCRRNGSRSLKVSSIKPSTLHHPHRTRRAGARRLRFVFVVAIRARSVVGFQPAERRHAVGVR